ncbi:hypothetical protein C9374_002109 [Naegleria lovaniensis]|uniref:B30.2/SPRY domain-containing protein n=1 Tax=Naegleria lovaniensis TaxID=51637 RepID=A0AA88GVU7_NAELO|nr:uncharacterized protein C9374_002109 [Naegleria lovaniensis]KAG2387074.1 hypothetical protein C9374_002109 [Naegleria lovaniensis]
MNLEVETIQTLKKTQNQHTLLWTVVIKTSVQRTTNTHTSLKQLLKMLGWLSKTFKKLSSSENSLSFPKSVASGKGDTTIELSSLGKKFKVNRESVRKESPEFANRWLQGSSTTDKYTIEIGKEKEEYMECILNYLSNDQFDCSTESLMGVLVLVLEYNFKECKEKIALHLQRHMKPLDSLGYFTVMYNHYVSRDKAPLDEHEQQIMTRAVFTILRFFFELEKNEQSRKILIEQFNTDQMLYIFKHNTISGIVVPSLIFLRFLSDWTLHDLQHRGDGLTELVQVEKNLRYGVVKCSSLDTGKEYGIKESETSSEFLHAEDDFKVESNSDHSLISITGTASQYAYIKTYNNTEMNFGVYTWRIKVNKFVFWLGIGVALKEKVENKVFDDFVSPYKSHGCYMCSANSYRWMPTEYTSSSFPFEAGDEIELTMDCESRKLTFRNLSKSSNNTQTIYKIQTPVYPSIVMGGQEEIEFKWLSEPSVKLN